MTYEMYAAVLKYCKYVLRHRGIQAQYAKHTELNTYWLGCFIVDVNPEGALIEIANGDQEWVDLGEVRIPGI